MAIENSSKFANSFSVKSSRLQNWDYSSPGIYFITICTVHHNNFFGKIINNQINLSSMGLVVREELLKTFLIRPNLRLHDYVIMPNHVHLLIEIKYKITNEVAETRHRHVSAITKKVLINKTNIHKPYIAIKKWKPNSIGSIINQFKSVVTRKIDPKTVFFGWQPRYHDIVVKNRKDLTIIKKYIKNNLINWEKDKFYR